MATLPVWSIKANGHYSGGMMIVAAWTEEEAQDIASTHPGRESFYRIDYQHPESVTRLPVRAKLPPRVLDFYEMGE